MSLEKFLEYAAGPNALRVDRQTGIIRDVKVLGYESKNGRTYTRAALAGAVAQYEGAKVNVNHAKKSGDGPRDYQDRIGQLANVHLASDGIRADLRVNPKHPMAEQLFWDAENAPGNVGLSHNIEGKVSRGRDGKLTVENIVAVHSVDLVADPATSNGLFEAAGVAQPDPQAEKSGFVERVQQVAREIGLPSNLIPWRSCAIVRPEILREFLLDHKAVAGRCQRRQRIDAFNPTCDPAAAEQFVGTVLHGPSLSAEQRQRLDEALGIPPAGSNGNGHGGSFLSDIL